MPGKLKFYFPALIPFLYRSQILPYFVIMNPQCEQIIKIIVAYRDFIGCSFQHNIACLIVHQTRLHCYKILCTFLCQFYERRAPAYHLKHIHPCIHRRVQHFLCLGCRFFGRRLLFGRPFFFPFHSSRPSLLSLPAHHKPVCYPTGNNCQRTYKNSNKRYIFLFSAAPFFFSCPHLLYLFYPILYFLSPKP